MSTIYCNNHYVVSVTLDRCAGVEAATIAAGLVYGGMIEVPIDNNAQYVNTMESFVDKEGDWSGIAFVSLNAPAQLEALLQLKDTHPGLVMGTFDLSDLAFSALDEGSLQFGIDQEPYLQGYWPIPVLTLAAQTGQKLLNNVIASGPSFITASPTEAQQTCEASFYDVCVPTDNTSDDTGLSQQGRALAIAFGIIGGLLLVGVVYAIYRINKLHAYINELEKKGERVPRNISARRRVSSIVVPPKSIIASAIAEEEVGTEDQAGENAKGKGKKSDVEVGAANEEKEDTARPQ